MVLPLVAVAGGLGLGAKIGKIGTQLYRNINSANLYSNEEKAYRALDNGYRSYLERQGRSINPNRAWTSYFGSAERNRVNKENATASAIGNALSLVSPLSGLYGSDKMMTSRWL